MTSVPNTSAAIAGSGTGCLSHTVRSQASRAQFFEWRAELRFFRQPWPAPLRLIGEHQGLVAR
jgi:hypothetical protein